MPVPDVAYLTCGVGWSHLRPGSSIAVRRLAILPALTGSSVRARSVPRSGLTGSILRTRSVPRYAYADGRHQCRGCIARLRVKTLLPNAAIACLLFGHACSIAYGTHVRLSDSLPA
eukprot:387135-Rhodomonas_salina.1